MQHRTRTAFARVALSISFVGGCVSPPAGPTAPAVFEPVAEPTADPMVSVNTLIDAPKDFALARIDTGEYAVPPHAKFLEGVRICLDPGHGGDAHKRGYKRGPTGVREAEVNLRVAEYLRDFLVYAGAEVLLTREGDVDVPLADRAGLANEWDADLFISCHHNAVKRPEVNHTSVWYHNDVDYQPSNLDLARYLCNGLYDALRLPQVSGVPLKSDQLMYAGGFAVLRHAEVTAALTESSFFTNPEEEQRLRDPEYNLREAYGMFMGLARYAAAGLPRTRLTDPEDGIVGVGAPAVLELHLDDGLRARKAWGHERQMVLTDSIAVRLDGEPVPHAFTNDGCKLTVELPADLSPGGHHVEVQFQNVFKNSVINPHFEIEVEE